MEVSISNEPTSPSTRVAPYSSDPIYRSTRVAPESSSIPSENDSSSCRKRKYWESDKKSKKSAQHSSQWVSTQNEIYSRYESLSQNDAKNGRKKISSKNETSIGRVELNFKFFHSFYWFFSFLFPHLLLYFWEFWVSVVLSFSIGESLSHSDIWSRSSRGWQNHRKYPNIIP